MTRPKLRVAAGAGAIAGFMMAGGAALPVVAADPGHSRDGGGSHRDGGSRGDGGSRRDGGGSHRDGGPRRGGGDYGRGDYGRGDGAGRYGQDRGERDDDRRGPAAGRDRGYGKDGGGNGRDWSRTDDEDTAKSDDFVIQPSTAARTASPSLAAPSVASPGLAAPGDTAVTEVSVPSVPAAPGPDSGGAAITEPNGPPFTAPPVVFGDGRTPGILTWSRASGGAPPQTAVGPAEILVVDMAPLVEAPPPVPAPSPPPASPPAVRLDVAPPWQRTVASLWAAAAEPSRPGGLGFGIAGLILAPLAGVWLGYRQARASRAAAQLVDR